MPMEIPPQPPLQRQRWQPKERRPAAPRLQSKVVTDAGGGYATGRPQLTHEGKPGLICRLDAFAASVPMAVLRVSRRWVTFCSP